MADIIHYTMQTRLDARNTKFLKNNEFKSLKSDHSKSTLEIRRKSRLDHFSATRRRPKQPEIQSVLSLSDCTPLIFSKNISDNIKGACNIRKLLVKDYADPTQEVVDSGVVPLLISFISRFDFPDLQYEAAWALSNIASGEQEYTKILVEKGIVPSILNLLDSPFDKIKDQAVWVLGNITGDTSSHSELICQYSGVQKLVRIIETTTSEYLIQSASWALGNICKGEKAPEFIVIKDAIFVFCKLIAKEDIEILKNSLWVLSSVTEYSEESCNILISQGVLLRLLEFFSHSEYEIQMPAILIIGHIAAGSDSQTTAIISAGVLRHLEPLLNSPKREIRKEAIWCISNIAAGTDINISHIVSAEIFPKVIRILYRDDREVKYEALWVLANAAGKGRQEQVDYLVRNNVIPGLVHCLNNNDPKFLQVVLLGIKLILKAGQKYLTESGINPYAVIFEESEGVKRLEALQRHHNFKICEEAYKILVDYLEAKSEDQDLVDFIASAY